MSVGSLVGKDPETPSLYLLNNALSSKVAVQWLMMHFLAFLDVSLCFLLLGTNSIQFLSSDLRNLCGG